MSLLQTHPNACRPAELLLRQLEGIDAWNGARQSRERALLAGPLSRQDKLDATRRLDMLAHVHATVLACTSSDLGRRPTPLDGADGLRAVLAHRNRWVADMLGRALAARGVETIAVSDNGAEALGVVVSEQPDLLVTGDVLMMLPAAELLSEAALFAPSTLRAVQVSHSDHVGPMLDAGADSVFTRQVSPQETVDGLVALLDLRL